MKKARFYRVKKTNGWGKVWEEFVPAQSAAHVHINVYEEHIKSEVSIFDWISVSVGLSENGVFFFAMIDGLEWKCYSGQEGYEFLRNYMQAEYTDAERENAQ